MGRIRFPLPVSKITSRPVRAGRTRLRSPARLGRSAGARQRAIGLELLRWSSNSDGAPVGGLVDNLSVGVMGLAVTEGGLPVPVPSVNLSESGSSGVVFL